MHVLACLAVLLLRLSRCVTAFEPPITAIRGQSVGEVLRELTADLDADNQDPKQLTRVYTRLHRLLYHRYTLSQVYQPSPPASHSSLRLLLCAFVVLSVPP